MSALVRCGFWRKRINFLATGVKDVQKLAVVGNKRPGGRLTERLWGWGINAVAQWEWEWKSASERDFDFSCQRNCGRGTLHPYGDWD